MKKDLFASCIVNAPSLHGLPEYHLKEHVLFNKLENYGSICHGEFENLKFEDCFLKNPVINILADGSLKIVTGCLQHIPFCKSILITFKLQAEKWSSQKMFVTFQGQTRISDYMFTCEHWYDFRFSYNENYGDNHFTVSFIPGEQKEGSSSISFSDVRFCEAKLFIVNEKL